MDKYVKDAKQFDFGLSKIKGACQINKTGLPKNILNLDENIFDVISEALTAFNKYIGQINNSEIINNVLSKISITHNDGPQIIYIHIYIGFIHNCYYRGTHTTCYLDNSNVKIKHVEDKYYRGGIELMSFKDHTRLWARGNQLGNVYTTNINISKEVRTALSK